MKSLQCRIVTAGSQVFSGDRTKLTKDEKGSAPWQGCRCGAIHLRTEHTITTTHKPKDTLYCAISNLSCFLFFFLSQHTLTFWETGFYFYFIKTFSSWPSPRVSALVSKRKCSQIKLPFSAMTRSWERPGSLQSMVDLHSKCFLWVVCPVGKGNIFAACSPAWLEWAHFRNMFGMGLRSCPPADAWIYSPLWTPGYFDSQNLKNDPQLGYVGCKAGQGFLLA